MNSFAGQVARNALLFFSSRLWEAIVGVGVVAILSRYLGTNGFGDYAVVFSMVNLVVPFTLMGIQQVGIREIACKEDAREKGQYLGSLLQARVLLMVLAGIIIAVILSCVSYQRHIVNGIIIFFFAMVIGSTGELASSSFIAEEKFQYQLYVLIAERCSLLVLIATVALLDLGFYAVFFSYLIAKSLKTLVALHFLRKKFFDVVFTFDWTWIKKIVKESYLIGFGISAGLGFHHAVILILRQSLGAEATGIFAAGYNLILKCQLLSISLSMSLMPRISREAKKNTSDYSKLVRGGMLILVTAGVVLALPAWSLRRQIMGTVYGAPFLVGADAFGYLVLLLPVLFLDNILNVAVISRRLPRLFFFAKFSGLVTGLTMTVVLIADHSFYAGVYGIISGKLLATLIMLAILRRTISAASVSEQSSGVHPDTTVPVG